MHPGVAPPRDVWENTCRPQPKLRPPNSQVLPPTHAAKLYKSPVFDKTKRENAEPFLLIFVNALRRVLGKSAHFRPDLLTGLLPLVKPSSLPILAEVAV